MKPFPQPRHLSALLALLPHFLSAAPVHLVDEAPIKISQTSQGGYLVDFGKVAFGNVRLTPGPSANHKLTLHFGEALKNGSIDRKPPGSVRYATTQLALENGRSQVAAPPADKRNTKQPAAILTPPEWGVVTPFRWLEIDGWSGELRPEHLKRQAAYLNEWDDQAAAFTSSEPLLDGIWELCRHSIKATTFAGIYVDGDRERIPYEADAYLNQLSHYATDRDIQMARDTYDRLMEQPTWPTEWASHMIFMAHADWMHTGDTAWLAPRFEKLKTKLLLNRTRADGLVLSNAAQIKRTDIVDWPTAERDGFIFRPINTVINAFHLRTLTLMAEMATALKKTDAVAEYTAQFNLARESFQKILYLPESGAYRDGEGTDHTSQHASLFPLAFGLVPTECRSAVTEFVIKKQMACSVYAAQYLLEGLFQNEAGTQALSLITAPTDRSWKHMFESGTTITWEAWDQKYKPNQDWNHAWGAAPANLFPRFILGAQALTPGWKRCIIRPHLGQLTSAKGKIPTPLGPILVEWTQEKNSFKMSVKLPPHMTAKIELPAAPNSREVLVNGQLTQAQQTKSRWILNDDLSGTASLEVR